MSGNQAWETGIGAAPPGKIGRPRRHTADARRAQLVDAAQDVFLEAGYHAATMSDIAQRAGMSKKTLYQLVASKEELFGMMLSDRLLPLSLPVEEDGRDPEAVLVDLLMATARFMMQPRQLAIARLVIAEAQRAPEVGQALARLGLGQGNSALEKWLAGPSARHLLQIEDPQEAAAMLFGCVVGEPVLSVLSACGPMMTDAQMVNRAHWVVRLFLRSPARAGIARTLLPICRGTDHAVEQ